MKKRILVAGGGGFIGGHLARKLADMGHFVRKAIQLKNTEQLLEIKILLCAGNIDAFCNQKGTEFFFGKRQITGHINPGTR